MWLITQTFYTRNLLVKKLALLLHAPMQWFQNTPANVRNKLECLYLASLSSLVYCLWVRQGAYPRVEYLKVASLG